MKKTTTATKRQANDEKALLLRVDELEARLDAQRSINRRLREEREAPSAATRPSYAERIGNVMAARWGTPEGTVHEAIDALYQIVSAMEDEEVGRALVSRVLEVAEALGVLHEELEAKGESARELEEAIALDGGVSSRTVRMARALLEEEDRPTSRIGWSQLLALLEHDIGSDQAMRRLRANAANLAAEGEQLRARDAAASNREAREGIEEVLRRLDAAEAKIDRRAVARSARA